MGFFDKLFGRKLGKATPLNKEDDEVPIVSTASVPIQGPPGFVRAAELQRAYWTHNRDEQAELERRGFDQLHWSEQLRLHHLVCMQQLLPAQKPARATAKCLQSARALIAPGSPWRRQSAMIWNGHQDGYEATSHPDFQGKLINASLTHLGCLEVYRLDSTHQPTRLDFVRFDELASIKIAAPGLIRLATLSYHDGRQEKVFIPMLYGACWNNGDEADRSGEVARFVTCLDDQEIKALGIMGIGVGRQDLSVLRPNRGIRVFDLRLVTEIVFMLDMHDPGFDAKARSLGMDPDEVRHKMRGPYP